MTATGLEFITIHVPLSLTAYQYCFATYVLFIGVPCSHVMLNESSQRYQQAVWIDEPGPDARVRVRTDVDIPKPKADEVLVKLQCTGVW